MHQLILLLKEVQTLCALPFTYPAEALVKGLRLLLRLRILLLRLTHMLHPIPRFLDTVEGREFQDKAPALKVGNLCATPSWSYTFSLFVSFFLKDLRTLKSAYSPSSKILRELVNIS